VSESCQPSFVGDGMPIVEGELQLLACTQNIYLTISEKNCVAEIYEHI
jgi:hypothetical protein